MWSDKGFLPYGPALEDNDWRMLLGVEALMQSDSRRWREAEERMEGESGGARGGKLTGPPPDDKLGPALPRGAMAAQLDGGVGVPGIERRREPLRKYAKGEGVSEQGRATGRRRARCSSCDNKMTYRGRKPTVCDKCGAPLE